MKNLFPYSFLIATALSFASCNQTETTPTETEIVSVSEILPSWNNTEHKTAITEFVTNACNPNHPNFIPEANRIAVFDNDGTLWSEQPYYFQLAYAIYFIKKEAANHPEWKDSQAIQAVLANDLNSALAGGEKALFELVFASHSNMTADAFEASVKDWLANDKHPVSGKPYTSLTFQPMLELLEYLRANDFKTFIVSGGGINFMRVFAEEAYGIPPYQIVGTSFKSAYKEVDGKFQIYREPELAFYDDKEGKPVGIYEHIGMRPAIAVGNSDGDFAMIQYTTQEPNTLGILIHHTDSVREYAYDRDSHIGTLVRGLDEGPAMGWIIVDMAKDWSLIYSAEK